MTARAMSIAEYEPRRGRAVAYRCVDTGEVATLAEWAREFAKKFPHVSAATAKVSICAAANRSRTYRGLRFEPVFKEQK